MTSKNLGPDCRTFLTHADFETRRADGRFDHQLGFAMDYLRRMQPQYSFDDVNSADELPAWRAKVRAKLKELLQIGDDHVRPFKRVNWIASPRGDEASLTIAAEGPLFRYAAPGSVPCTIEGPVFEIDSALVKPVFYAIRAAGAKALGGGITERRFTADYRNLDGLTLTIVVRTAEGSPVVRFRYILSDTAGRKLTKKTTGRDATDYAAFSAAQDARVTDVRLSDFNHLLNGYLPTETALPPRAFENALTAPGPILASVDAEGAFLMAYEHGSTLPNTFFEYRLAPDRLLEEIDAAHRAGVETFVIDVGWFNSAGDWRPHPRYPEGLKPICERLERHGMKLGLWIHAAWAGNDSEVRTLAPEGHGGPNETVEERRDGYAYGVPVAIARIAESISEACPDVVVDFDMTEGGRSMGLGILATARYFLVNNGPYYQAIEDVPFDRDKRGWNNIFVHPGPSRAQVLRYALDFDRWIPANLLLAHYLPTGDARSIDINLASVVLGQNGLWGGSTGLPNEQLDRIGRTLADYREVRDDANAACAVRLGRTGCGFEVHERLNPANGRGLVSIFSNADTSFQTADVTPEPTVPLAPFVYVTERKAAAGSVHATHPAKVTQLPDGRARIEIKFDGRPDTTIVFFK